jgi:OsmC-like protein
METQMNANGLRAMQAPIKERDRSGPQAAVVTLGAKSTLDIPLKSGRVSAEGGLDFRGTLGVAKDAPAGFREIRLRFDLDLDTDAAQDKLDQLLKLAERYCVVYQTIKTGPPVVIKLARV